MTIDSRTPSQLAKCRAARQPLCALLLAAAVACGTTEGPLLRTIDAGAAVTPDQVPGGSEGVEDEGSAAPQDVGASPVAVAAGMRLHYQITGTPEVDAAADLFVLDLFDATPSQLAALHARGRLVIAYLSAGSLERWRPDAEDFPAQAIGSELANYRDERWLDIRDSRVRALMQARLTLARDKGFDGVYPGALDAYRNQSGFTLSQRDQLDYDQFVSSAARALGLTPGLSSDFSLSAQLVEHFDWAIAIGCLAAGSCEGLRPWIDQNKPVFDLELEGELNEVCAQAAQLGISAVMKRPSFDGWSRACP